MTDLAPRTCGYCGKPFEWTNPRQKFCNRGCKGGAAARRFQALHPERWKEMLAKADKTRRDKIRDLGLINERGRKSYRKSRQNTPWVHCCWSAKARAKKQGLPFSLTREWAEARWTGRCEMTDIPFVLGVGCGPATYSPSVDRIRPELGYVPDNCRFILHAVNAMKGTGTDEEVFAIAKAIIRKLTPD